MPGFPIRTPSDLSSVDSSPRLIAASYVLHRLLMPRHPPCALNNLTTKMLASTVQFSNNHPKQPPLKQRTSQTRELSFKNLRYDTEVTRGTKKTQRVFSQDPTVCQTPHSPPSTHAFHDQTEA